MEGGAGVDVREEDGAVDSDQDLEPWQEVWTLF